MINWNDILDYVRGIASPEVRQRVEADALAMERVRLMTAVNDSLKAEMPEQYIQRAKALLPTTPDRRFITASLAYASGPAGFRAGSATARDLRFEFEGGSIELRIEQLADARQLAIVGLVSTASNSQFRVHDAKRWHACDEHGQFDIVVPAATRSLRFESELHSEVIEVVIE